MLHFAVLHRCFVCLESGGKTHRQQKNYDFFYYVTWLALLWYLIYCSGLEPNPQYLWGVLVHSEFFKGLIFIGRSKWELSFTFIPNFTNIKGVIFILKKGKRFQTGGGWAGWVFWTVIQKEGRWGAGRALGLQSGDVGSNPVLEDSRQISQQRQHLEQKPRQTGDCQKGQVNWNISWGGNWQGWQRPIGLEREVRTVPALSSGPRCWTSFTRRTTGSLWGSLKPGSVVPGIVCF